MWNSLKKMPFCEPRSRLGEIPVRTKPPEKFVNVNPSDDADCILALDVSVSMDNTDWKPSRLAAAKSSAKTFVLRLSRENPMARVGVVVFSAIATVVCGLIPASAYGKISSLINGMRTEGSTNIHDGLYQAKVLLQGSPNRCQIVLLTDGDYNVGPCPIAIATELKTVAEINTIGIGGRPTDVNEPLLKEMASFYPDGVKRYRWIGDAEELRKHFDDLAGGICRS